MQGKDQKGDIKKPPVKKIFSPKPRKGKKEGKKEGKKQWRALRSLSIIENIVTVKSMPRKDKKRKVASPARKTNGEPEETTQESKLEMV